MTTTGDRLPGRFISYFRLIDACDGPGCPVCGCLAADSRQYLESLLDEQVNDPDTRRRLRTSWGFCNWHAWMLREAPDPAFGSAIIYEDLLRILIQRFERGADRLTAAARAPLGWLRRLYRRPPRSLLVELFRRREKCPACEQMAASEEHYVRIALQFIDDPQFDRAYRRSQGLCAPHALMALDLGIGTAGARQLVARTLPKWAELRRDLQGFVGKHDYRNQAPFTEAEATSYLLALEAMTGKPGLFGNDVRAGSPGSRRRRVVEAGAAELPAPAGHDEAFERAKLELRIKELGAQLDEASSRAAALHYRLAQVAEDRNALELNVSGERAANELGQRVIAELRAEIERLRAELSAARRRRV